MFSVLTEGLAPVAPKAADMVAPEATAGAAQAAAQGPAQSVAPKASRLAVMLLVGGLVVAALLLWALFRPRKTIDVLAQKAEYNSMFDAPFSTLPGPLMKMPTDHLVPLRTAGPAVAPAVTPAVALHTSAATYAPPVLAVQEDIVPITGSIPVWGDETVTEKLEPKVDEYDASIARLVAERESFTKQMETDLARALNGSS